MSSEKDNILEFNQYVKWNKMPCIIYADIESITKKIDRFLQTIQKSFKQQK